MRQALLIGLVACGSAAKPAPAPTPGPAPTPSPAPVAITIPTANGPGKVETHHFHSAALGVDKDYVVYLPGGYGADPHARWPVVYYLNGLGGDETNWTEMADLGATADRVHLAAIVVMPDGDDGFYSNWVQPARDYDACMKDGTGLFDPREDRAKTCVRTANYEDYIVKDLVAHVDATYATIADRRARGIAGLSMGGFGALELAMRHPDEFAATASHSGVDALLYAGPHPYEAGKAELVNDVATWGRVVEPIGGWVRTIFGPDKANWEAHDPAALAQKLAPGQLAIYLDCGTSDFFGLDAQASYLHDVLTARKIAHSFYLGPGTHDFDFWKPRVEHSLAFFAAVFAGQPPPVEAPAPPAPPAPQLEVKLLDSLAGDGVSGDLVEHLTEGIVQGAKMCAFRTKADAGVRELAIGLTADAQIADVQWLRKAPHDEFADCLVPAPSPSAGDLHYVYVAIAILEPGMVAAAGARPDAAADLRALCAGKLEDVRHPDILALAHALAAADPAKKRALLRDALARTKVPLKACALARAR